MTIALQPEQKPRMFAEAMNAADLETMLSFYDENATFVPPGGTPAHGKAAIRAAMVEFLALSPTMRIAVRKVHRAGDIALVIGDWTIEGRTPGGEAVSLSGANTEVQKRYPDGGWRCLIDSPEGTAA